MSAHGPLAENYIALIRKLFAGDLEGCGAYLTEGCTWNAPAGQIDGRDAIIATASAARANWASHEVVSSTEGGNLVALVARNTYTDGSSGLVAAIAKFDQAGLICEMKGVDSR